MKRQSNNKGFTLIELIVVMIIIGILVLLATPRFIKYIKMARYTNIINDVRTVETVSLPMMTRNNSFPEGTLTTPIKDFSSPIKDRKIYAKDGHIVQNKEDEFVPEVGRISEVYGDDLGNYYLLDKESFIKLETRTRLKGDFFINHDGDVIYIDDNEFIDNFLDISNMYLYDDLNPGKIVGINSSHPMWNSLNKKANPDYNPDFKGLAYDEIDWNQIISLEDYTENKDFYNSLGISFDDLKYIMYQLATTKDMIEFPGIPKTRKLEDGSTQQITEIGDRAFEGTPFYGSLSIDNIEKIGSFAFFSSEFTGDFKAPNLKELGSLALSEARFTGDFSGPKVEKIGYGALQSSNFTGDFNCPNLEKLGAFAFISSEFTGDFNAQKLSKIEEYAFTGSKFRGKFNAPNIVKIENNNFTNSVFTGDFTTNLYRISKENLESLNLSYFDGDFNAPNLMYIEGDLFTNTKFKGRFNAPNITSINSYAFMNSEFIGDFNSTYVEYIGEKAFLNSKFDGSFGKVKKHKSFEETVEDALSLWEMEASNGVISEMEYGESLKYLEDNYEELKIEHEENYEGCRIEDYAFENSIFIGNFESDVIYSLGRDSFYMSNFDGEFNVPNIRVMDPAFQFSEFTSYIPNNPDLIEAIKSRTAWRK